MPDLTPLFGLLIIDRDPFTFADLPGLAQAWLMDVGGFAFIGLGLYLGYVLVGRATEFDSAGRAAIGAANVVGGGGAGLAVAGALALGKKTTPEREHRYPLSVLMVLCFALAMLTYSVYGLLLLTGKGVDLETAQQAAKFDPTGYNKYVPPFFCIHETQPFSWSTFFTWLKGLEVRWQPFVLALAGLFAIVGIGTQFFAALGHLVRRAAATGRAPKGTPGLASTMALMLAAWVGLGFAGFALVRQFPSARELIGVGAIVAAVLVAGWAVYRCRLADRFGAVYAVAKLSVLDVIRSRVFLALLVLLLPALFPITWFLPFKAEDELRLTVGVTTAATQVVLLLMAAALASFAIPNDVKNQNIYTVLTKPVQPFDVVLGRFFGYSALATVALAVMTFGSWLLIEASNISPQAKEETFKARVPIRGKLRFASRAGENIEGTDVGREFNYRKYIAGHPASSQRGVWTFSRLPSSLPSATDAAVPIEFTFDIYRLTKGIENRGVDVNIRVVTWRCPQKPPERKSDGTWQWVGTRTGADGKVVSDDQAYEERAKELLFALDQQNPPDKRQYASRAAVPDPKPTLGRARPGSPEWQVANELASEYGFYEIPQVEVFDYHPVSVVVPAGLFAHAATTRDADGRPLPAPADPQATGEPGQVLVYVKCQTSSQMLGMAEGDLYLLEAEQSFGQNFFKAAFGLWCRLVILIGLAVVCSTYLAGVVSFLAGGFVFVAGYFGQYITELAMGKSTAGGPIASLSQLSQAKLPTAPSDPTGGTRAAEFADNIFAWLIRRVVNLFPDVSAYDWTPFLAEGFNVSFENLAMNLIVMIGYLIPWLILGFYLIRSREVAA